MRVADYIFSFLADYGVEDVFMLSGGGAMFLNDALGQEKRLRIICNHHEQGASIAAEGSSRVNGKLSVVSVTTGPGGTNALTGVIGEWLDSQPVLFISGQVKFPTTIASVPDLGLRQLGDQEINIIDIVKPITKYAAMVRDPLQIKAELKKAISLATTGRKGPVWLDIPINVQSAEINPQELPDIAIDSPEFRPDHNQVTKVCEILQSSRSPVIVAGHGIRLSSAINDFLTLVSKLKIPVLGTFNGFDILPSDSPFMVGRIGTIGNRAGNIALQNSDCVICIGTRNNIRQVSYNFENFAKKAKHLICVDIDSAELNKPTVSPTLKINADAGIFIKCLLDVLPEDLPDWQQWLEWCNSLQFKFPVVTEDYKHTSSGIQPYLFTHKLTEMLPKNAIVACTNATPSICLFQAGIVKSGQRMFANSGCAAMGYGLPAALGAAVAGKGRPVICLEGDGSLMMNLQELQTVKHNDLPVKLFLYNNDEYTSIRQTHDNFFKGRRTGCDKNSGVDFPDWQLIAAAFGWKYYIIDSLLSAENLLPEILSSEAPVFCNVKLSFGYIFSPKLSSKVLPDGKIVSPSLEDMYPFLSPEEMKATVYTPQPNLL